MDKFVPDIYKQSIYTINYNKLKKHGIKCLIFDLNNTLVSANEDRPSKKLSEFIYNLQKDFKIIIVSNDSKKRVKPFKEILNVDSAYHAYKPLLKKYKKIIDIYNYKDTEVSLIGDTILTDIYSGNRMGFTTILVNSISNDIPFIDRIFKSLDKHIIKKLNKKGILYKGEYYD